jgi:predicted ArsR family transcriptional regulator
MDVFEALAAPTRREIVEILASTGKLSASDIYQRFDASPPAISQHLKILRESIDEWTQKMTRIWNKRLDALEKVLQAEKEKLRSNTKKGRK